MSRVQYIDSITVGNTKLILWNRGNYQYQIETKIKDTTKVFNFEAEYNEAVCEFIMQASKLNKQMA